MQQGNEANGSDGVVEYWSAGRLSHCSTAPSLHYSIARLRGFALYEVVLGVTVFVIGVLALGRSVENCLNASSLSAEEDRVRQILSNRMAEIQATPGIPESVKKTKVESGYGPIDLIQKCAPSKLKEADGTDLHGVNTVTLTAEWVRGGVAQSKSLDFYVYRGS